MVLYQQINTYLIHKHMISVHCKWNPHICPVACQLQHRMHHFQWNLAPLCLTTTRSRRQSQIDQLQRRKNSYLHHYLKKELELDISWNFVAFFWSTSCSFADYFNLAFCLHKSGKSTSCLFAHLLLLILMWLFVFLEYGSFKLVLNTTYVQYNFKF